MTNPWTDQRKRWQRFEAWEFERLRSEPTDFAKALAWMSDAWELASQADPAWPSSFSKADRFPLEEAEGPPRVGSE